jgi:hypothetical protein
MEVWDETVERRTQSPRRIRRFRDWKDFALFVVEITGGLAICSGLVVTLLTSMGFTWSGSGTAIADIRRDDVVRDTAIAKLQRQNDVFSSRLDDIVYLVCEQTKRNQPGIILPRSCK